MFDWICFIPEPYTLDDVVSVDIVRDPYYGRPQRGYRYDNRSRSADRYGYSPRTRYSAGSRPIGYYPYDDADFIREKDYY